MALVCHCGKKYVKSDDKDFQEHVKSCPLYCECPECNRLPTVIRTSATGTEFLIGPHHFCSGGKCLEYNGSGKKATVLLNRDLDPLRKSDTTA